MQSCTSVSLCINAITLFDHEGAEEALFTMTAVGLFFFQYFFKIKAIIHFPETE